MKELIGHTINGRYRIDTQLGHGGMAEVYKVWDHDRAAYLAMKVLHDDLAEDVVFLRRFRREAHTLAKLQHPNIVSFYGLYQKEDLAFMLMEYVEGYALRKEIFRARGSGMSPNRILEIMRPVCSALYYAHRNGMVHCDVKPANIMIEKSGRVLVTDFGISRMMDAATSTMVGVGTPAYMAPEQVLGMDPTPQADIYALGVVLYEMATGGERPFIGQQAEITGSTGEKVRWEQLNLSPPSPREYNANLSVEFEQIILKCLEKDPGKRYPGMIDLLNALERSLVVTGEREMGLVGQEINNYASPMVKERQFDENEAYSGLEPGMKKKPERRNPMLWILLAGGALVVLIGILLIGKRPSAPMIFTETKKAPESTVLQSTFQEISENIQTTALPAEELSPSPTLTIEKPTIFVTQTETISPTETPLPQNDSVFYDFKICVEEDFNGKECEMSQEIFLGNLRRIYGSWKHKEVPKGIVFSRKYYYNGSLLWETVNTSGENERWSFSGDTVYIYIDAREGTAARKFGTEFLPKGEYRIELYYDRDFVQEISFLIQ